ncbi:arylesterase [Thalassolituus sp.]|uniref:arylesterase n=1 Tax=Thalassolituus sp. TaxID=2030822 RepID=UPI002601C905|nr:arylesterase [uncultured Thalassolituus sp.]
MLNIVRLPLILLVLLPALAQGAPSVVIVGDSISAGFGVPLEQQWPVIMEDSLRQEFPELSVVAAAISGDTTSGGRSRLPALLSEHAPDVLVIALGGNDALRGTPLTVVETNLKAMAETAIAAGVRVVIAGMQIPPNYGPAYTSRFRAIYPAVAEQTGSDVIPFMLEGIATVEGMMQEDGIHPTTAAQPRLAELVGEAVIRQLRAAQ